MKKQTWVKWLTGVSGALLFTGFVGYIDNSGSAHSDNSSLTASSGYEQSQDNDRNSTQQQPRERRGDFGSGFDRSDSGDNQSDGRIRTHAS